MRKIDDLIEVLEGLNRSDIENMAINSTGNETIEGKNDKRNLKSYFVRDQYAIVMKRLQDQFITTLYGPSKVGKTTIMLELRKELLKNNRPEQILYYSFESPYVNYDASQLNPFDVIKEFCQMNNMRLGEQKLFVLFDNIEYLDQWASKIKTIYDLRRKIKFIISVSSKMEIKICR